MAKLPPEYPKSLDDSLTPDVSSRPFGFAGAGLLACAAASFLTGAWPLGAALLTVGLPLVTLQAYPQIDKGAKGYGMLAACAIAGAILAPAAAPALLLGAAASAGLAYSAQSAHKRRLCEQEIARDQLRGEMSHVLEKGWGLSNPPPVMAKVLEEQYKRMPEKTSPAPRPTDYWQRQAAAQNSIPPGQSR